MEVVIVAGVAIVTLMVIGLFFMKPEKYDPTKAKIPDHMKKSVAWRAHEREQEKKRRNRWSA